MGINFYSGCLQVQSFNHRLTTCCYQNSISIYKVRGTIGSIRISQSHPVMRIMNRLCTHIQADLNAFLFHYLPDTFGNIRVIAGHKSVSCFEDSDFASESGIHGRKFQANITATYDNQVFRQDIQIQESSTGVHISTLLNTFYIRNDGCGAGIDKNLLSLQFDFFFRENHFHSIGRNKRSHSRVNSYIRTFT